MTDKGLEAGEPLKKFGSMEPESIKGIRPVANHAMINFLQWLTINHPEIDRLADLSERELIHLADEFESGRAMTNPARQYEWVKGFRLVKTAFAGDGYDDARTAWRRLR